MYLLCTYPHSTKIFWLKPQDKYIPLRYVIFRVASRFGTIFRFGIGRYFPGILPTDTEGKLGRDVSVSYIWREPLFPSKGGFCPLFDGPSPPFERKISSRRIYKKEFPQNFTKWSSRQIFQYKNTEPNIPTGKCR
jgi:hypothetical protein